MHKKKSFNKVVSIILFISFILLPVSAAMIDGQSGSIIGHIGKVTHILAGLSFTTAGVFHIVFHWKTLKSYLKH